MAMVKDVTYKMLRKKNRRNHETGNVSNAIKIKTGNVSFNSRFEET